MPHTMTFEPRPVTLTGTHVRLEPLADSHLDDLLVAGGDAELWRYLPSPPFATIDDVRRWFDASRDEERTGSQVAFAIVHRAGGTAVGSTRFLEIRRPHRALEIGWTWIGRDFQRTAVNTECKLLLLRHAFEDLGTARMQFKTDARNERSQRAIERIGGTREGVLRHHMIMPDGHHRDSVYYSITAGQWPEVEAKLTTMLQRADT